MKAEGERRLAMRGALLERFYAMWQRCESGRGCYSCAEAHDCRCAYDLSQGETPCTCGRAELDALAAELKEDT